MKIIYKQGDLFGCKEKIIIHGCNSMGVMGAGVAKTIKEKYPKAFQVYYRGFGPEHFRPLGHIFRVICEDKYICNAITQQYYGRDPKVVYVSYDAVRKAFNELNRLIMYGRVAVEHWGRDVAMPKIGAGLANGDWNVISQIIEEESTHFQPVVYSIDGVEPWR